MKTLVEATTSNSKTTLVLTSKHVDSSIRMDYLRAYKISCRLNVCICKTSVCKSNCSQSC